MATPDSITHPFASFAAQMADASGKAIMQHYRQPLRADSKGAAGAFDPVTVADRAAEMAIRDMIEQRWPGHGIIGEEYGTTRADAEYIWVIDPIDGTRAFMSGIPTWGTLIGLLHHGEPVLGLLDQPHLGERFIGDMKGTMRTGQRGEAPLKTRQGVRLADACIWVSSTITTRPAMFASLQRLAPQVRMLRYGSDCISMAMLAEGHIDAVIETGLEIYDIAAQVPIVTGAGGIITALDGSAPLSAGSILAAGDPGLHMAIRATMNGAGR
ncbi:MAG: inositol monophosphatase family protein [Beijerinckiaceae bacterium]